MIVIFPLDQKDISKTFELIKAVTLDSFVAEGENLQEERTQTEIAEILATQAQRLEQYIQNKQPFFFVAKENEKIIGAIALGEASHVIQKALAQLEKKFPNLPEILSLYIDPQYQRKGIGSMLFDRIMEKIRESSYEFFSVYTGYKTGLHFWTKKLGEPSVIFENYYGVGFHCWVWIRETAYVPKYLSP